MVTALLEDTCKVGEETFKVAFDVLIFLAVYKSEDAFTCTERVGPFLHF